jgi:hypothetical protein
VRSKRFAARSQARNPSVASMKVPMTWAAGFQMVTTPANPRPLPPLTRRTRAVALLRGTQSPTPCLTMGTRVTTGAVRPTTVNSTATYSTADYYNPPTNPPTTEPPPWAIPLRQPQASTSGHSQARTSTAGKHKDSTQHGKTKVGASYGPSSTESNSLQASCAVSAQQLTLRIDALRVCISACVPNAPSLTRDTPLATRSRRGMRQHPSFGPLPRVQ